jgi:hypothetical protein
MKKIIMCMALEACMSCWAQSGEMLPSDTDLTAAYCVGVKLKQVELSNRIQINLQDPRIPEEMRKKALQARNNELSDLNRLKRYVLTRMLLVDAVNLTFATKSGEADVDQVMQVVSSCVTTCEQKGTMFVPCVNACSDSTTKKRIQTCNDISWLPY